MTDKLVLIDSNILVYAYDSDEKAKNNTARKILEEVIKNKINIALSTQNLSEFYVNVTKKIEKPISQEMAKNIIKDLTKLTNIKILKISSQTILNAIDASIKCNISYWDALIASAMQENNINTIITENLKDFTKIPEIQTVNPFAA